MLWLGQAGIKPASWAQLFPVCSSGRLVSGSWSRKSSSALNGWVLFAAVKLLLTSQWALCVLHSSEANIAREMSWNKPLWLLLSRWNAVICNWTLTQYPRFLFLPIKQLFPPGSISCRWTAFYSLPEDSASKSLGTKVGIWHLVCLHPVLECNMRGSRRLKYLGSCLSHEKHGLSSGLLA